MRRTVRIWAMNRTHAESRDPRTHPHSPYLQVRIWAMGSHEQLVEFGRCSRPTARAWWRTILPSTRWRAASTTAPSASSTSRRPRSSRSTGSTAPRRRARVRPRRPPAVLRLARRRPLRVRRAALVPAVPLVHRRHPRRLAVHRDRARRQRHRRRRPAVEGLLLFDASYAAARAPLPTELHALAFGPPGPARLDRQPRAALVPALRRVGRPRRAARPLCRRARRAPNGVRGPRGLSQRPLPRERRQRPDRQRGSARKLVGGRRPSRRATSALRSRDLGLLRARRPIGHLGGGGDAIMCGSSAATPPPTRTPWSTSPPPRRVPPQGRPRRPGAARRRRAPLPTPSEVLAAGAAAADDDDDDDADGPSGMADDDGPIAGIRGRRRSSGDARVASNRLAALDQDGLDQAAAYADAQYAKAAEYEDDDEDEYEQYERPRCTRDSSRRRMTRRPSGSCRGPSSRTTTTRTTRRGGRVRRRRVYGCARRRAGGAHAVRRRLRIGGRQRRALAGGGGGVGLRARPSLRFSTHAHDHVMWDQGWPSRLRPGDTLVVEALDGGQQHFLQAGVARSQRWPPPTTAASSRWAGATRRRAYGSCRRTPTARRRCASPRRHEGGVQSRLRRAVARRSALATLGLQDGELRIHSLIDGALLLKAGRPSDAPRVGVAPRRLGALRRAAPMGCSRGRSTRCGMASTRARWRCCRSAAPATAQRRRPPDAARPRDGDRLPRAAAVHARGRRGGRRLALGRRRRRRPLAGWSCASRWGGRPLHAAAVGGAHELGVARGGGGGQAKSIYRYTLSITPDADVEWSLLSEVALDGRLTAMCWPTAAAARGWWGRRRATSSTCTGAPPPPRRWSPPSRRRWSSSPPRLPAGVAPSLLATVSARRTTRGADLGRLRRDDRPSAQSSSLATPPPASPFTRAPTPSTRAPRSAPSATPQARSSCWQWRS